MRYALAVDEKGQAYALNDPQAESLKVIGAAQVATPEACVQTLLNRQDLWGTVLPQSKEWLARVTYWHHQVLHLGVDGSLQFFLSLDA